MAAEIDMIIEPNGESHMEVNGGEGKGCKDMTADFEAIFGEAKDRKLKPEYNRVGPACPVRKQQAGR